MEAVQTRDVRHTIKQPGAAREWLAGRAGADDARLALLLVGIKDLKQINDRLGRGAGDVTIAEVGKHIETFANEWPYEVTMVARLPGREFMLAIEGNADREQLEQAAKELLDVLSVDKGSDPGPIRINGRIGIAQAAPGESGTDLLARAGKALASAYARKGERFVFTDYDESQPPQIILAIDAGLRAAVIDGKISIVFQPQFEVATGCLVGAEALARLHHAGLGEVGAGDLFSAADRCDLREELSHLIQSKAIGLAASWPSQIRHLRLAVNLGAEELTQDYAAHLLELLERTGFPANRLTLELTEESLIRDIELAAAQLDILRGHNIRIAIDDFGTGYSSLSYLKTLPLDYLKIDKGMTPDIGGAAKDRIVLRAIIAMGKALGLKIIAEGVERSEELEMLKAEDCDYFQGYLRSAPLSPVEFENFALENG